MGRVKINPEALKWARIEAGYDYSNLPNKIKPKFKEWESGQTMPTWNQLCDISNYFKRPSAFFFRKNLPEHLSLDFIEYRKLNNFQFQSKSPKLTLGIHEAISKRETYMELLEDLHYPKTSFSKLKLDSKNVDLLSNHIRKILDVDLDEQKSWLYNDGRKDTKHYNFINHWKDRLEKLGILIFEVSRVSLDEMRALCIYYDEYPIILLNGADSPNARIFSLFHELTHLILGESAICDVDKSNSKEWLCNSVAAQFLIPKDDLLNNSIVKDNFSNELTNRELCSCAKDEDCKNGKDKSFSGEGNLIFNQIKYGGRSYSSLLLTAYETGVLSDVEFSQAVGLKLKHVDDLYQTIFN